VALERSHTDKKAETTMPPMLFTALVGMLFNLFFAGVLPTHHAGLTKLDGAVRIEASVN
jgi:hypothetical protein